MDNFDEFMKIKYNRLDNCAMYYYGKPFDSLSLKSQQSILRNLYAEFEEYMDIPTP